MILSGGTFDAVGASRLDLAWYNEHDTRLTGEQILDRLPELRDLADIDVVPFRRVSSSALSVGDWLDLSRLVHALLQTDGRAGSGYDGIVVTHGTNTMEETAFMLHLTVDTGKPVVLVGAMRPVSGLSSDSPLNLVRAVQVAASSEAAGLGVLVVMNDTVYAAREVTKSATYRLDAFDARDLGPLGYADADGRVVIYHRPVRVPEGLTFDVQDLHTLPRVDVVLSYVGADSVMIDAAVAAGARGIVCAGTGAGRVTPAEEEALSRAIDQDVVVCQSTRVGSGRVGLSPAVARRRVDADNLQPWKARVLLSLCLTRGSELAPIQAAFDRF